MKQVFTDLKCELDQTIPLDEKQAHHLFDVLRTKENETIRLISNGEVYLAKPQKKPFVFVFEREQIEPRLVDVTLCTALIKSDKFEWMLQKAASLGSFLLSRGIPSFNSMTKKPSKRWIAGTRS